MNDTSDKARSKAALQLAQWMFLQLLGKGVISQEEAKRILERAIQLSTRNNQDQNQVAKIFERMLSALQPDQSPRRR
jgi:membrane peptidoglycan carboxypeptidase